MDFFLSGLWWIRIRGLWSLPNGSYRLWDKLRLSLMVGPCSVQFTSLQLFSHVQLFVTKWTAAHQASLTITNPGGCSNLCPLSWWCHPTISSSVIPSPPTFNLSHHQDLFQWASSSHQVAKILEFRLQHQSYNEYSELISFRMDWLDLLAVQGTLKSLL